MSLYPQPRPSDHQPARFILIERRAVRHPYLGWRVWKILSAESEVPTVDDLSLKSPFHEWRVRHLVDEFFVDRMRKG